MAEGELLKTLAAKPIWKSLSTEMRKRVSRDQAWSPSLGLLADPDELIEEDDELWEVAVKYDKSQEPPYVIVSAKAIQQELSHARMLLTAPWIYGGKYENAEKIAQPHESVQIRHQYKKVNKETTMFGVCIVTRYPNRKYKEERKGSSELVDYFFDANIGVIKHVRDDKENEPIPIVGQWYRSFLNDKRQKGCEQFKKNREHQCDSGCQNYMLNKAALTTRDLNSFENPPMQTWNEVPDPEQMQNTANQARCKGSCNFIFKTSTFLGENDVVKPDAYFYHVYLGKIKVTKAIGKEIVEKIHSHRSKLEESQLKERLELPILITVQVTLVKKWEEECWKSEFGALFVTEKLLSIAYTVGFERSIYELSPRRGETSLSS